MRAGRVVGDKSLLPLEYKRKCLCTIRIGTEVPKYEILIFARGGKRTTQQAGEHAEIVRQSDDVVVIGQVSWKCGGCSLPRNSQRQYPGEDRVAPSCNEIGRLNLFVLAGGQVPERRTERTVALRAFKERIPFRCDRYDLV